MTDLSMLEKLAARWQERAATLRQSGCVPEAAEREHCAFELIAHLKTMKEQQDINAAMRPPQEHE